MNQKHTVNVPEYRISISTGSIGKLRQRRGQRDRRRNQRICGGDRRPTTKPGQDWFPLIVDYREKYHAAGRFPGGYFKREGRSDGEGDPDVPPAIAPAGPSSPRAS